ncbi:phage tail tape measure protein [Heyndrickxia faecalis]|uniref:phage tail tape measure protein n=1 Tax=Heyndrickxia TaxID=2837504 RepID=UPI002E225F38|nr:phage tail tape measure protein [Weizmannia sp. CD-2023]MED4977224.1 phage tail tape measure protein [Weizmannia sp. CD-2023]
MSLRELNVKIAFMADIAALNKVNQQINKTVGIINGATNKINNTSSAFDEMSAHANHMSSTVNQTANGFNQHAADMHNHSEMISDAMQNVGYVALGMGGSVAAGMTVAMKKGADFEAQMSKVGSIAGASKSQLNDLTNTALNLGAKTSKSSSEVAVAMQDLASKGYNAQKIIAAMPGIIKASEASGEDLAKVSDVVTSAINAFQMKAGDANKVADIMSATANKTSAGVEDLGYSFKYAAPVAHSLGISLSELAASTGIMTDAGLAGEQAGTTLRAGLISLLNPADNTSKMMETLGIKVTDQNGKFVGLAGVIKNFQSSMKGMTNAQKLATLSTIVGTEASSGFLALMQAGPTKIKNMTKALDNSGGSAAKTAKKMKDNVQGSFENLGGAIETAMIKTFNSIKVPIKSAADSVTKLVNLFNKLPAPMRTAIAIMIVITSGLTILGGVALIATAGFMGLSSALNKTAIQLGIISLEVLAVVAVFALVVAGIYLMWNKFAWFRNGVIAIWNGIKTAAIAVWGFLSPYINQVISAVVGFVQSKMNALKMFWSQNGASILQAAQNIWTPIRIVVTAVMNAIWAVMKFVWPIVLALIKSVWGNIKGVINGALNIIMGLVKIFAGLFTLNFSQMWSGIKQVFFGAIQFIWNYIQLMMFGRVLSAGKAFIVSLKNVFVALWSGARTIFIGGINAIRAFVVGGFNGLKNASMSILKSLSSGVRAIWNGLRSGLSGIVSRIVSGIKSGWNSARSFTVSIFSGIKNFVSKTFTDIVNGAKALPGKIGAGIKSMAGKAMSGVKHLANTLVGGLAQGVNGVIGGVNWVLGKIGVKSRIPTWPPPKYANGTDGHPGGLAFVGDGRGSNAGPELIRMPSGQVGLSPSTTTLVNLPKGTEVLPAKQTRALLNSGIAPAYAGGIGSKIKNVAINVWEGTKNIASKAAGAVKAVASKVKDVGLDIWSYVSNPSKLMKKVYEQFIPSLPSISGSFGTILKGSMSVVKDKAISYVKEKLAIADNPPGNDVQRWKATVIRALGMNGLPTTPAYVNAWLKQIATESGGNAKAIQSMAVNDINARTGNLARGLVQVIPPTFNAFKFKGFGNIMRGLDNLLAGINYAKHRYGVKGMLSVIGKGHGYAKGTNYHPGGIAMVGDGVGSNSGAELFRLPNGVLGLTPQKPTLMNLPRGTQVVPAKETREILSNSAVTSSIDSHLITKSSVLKENVNSVPAYASGIGDWFQITTGNSWSNTETGDSNSSSVYSLSTNTAGAKNTVFTYSPNVDIHIDGNVDDNTRQNLKDEFQIMLNEHYKKLLDLFGPEEVV